MAKVASFYTTLSLLAATLSLGIGQVPDCFSTSITSCGGCISVAGCAWCSVEGYAEPRCQPETNLTSSGSCMTVENPTSSFQSKTTQQTQTESAPPIDLINISFTLRVGDPQTFQVTVTPQRNLPLDLYILIDTSSSMSQELSTIQSVSSSIAETIKEITNNVRLGFGAFNDKVVQPYAQESLDLTCSSSATYCPSYAFRHTVNLTDNTTDFARQVNLVSLTENVDPPENGLEGLAQVITCESLIGWRFRTDNIGTRVVLYMTDEEFHFSGEGRFAGILNPYNGECLLEHNPDTGFFEFTRFKDFDYPSVGHILDLITRFDVTTIFAIRQDHVASYNNLANILNTNSLRSSVAGFTPTDSGANSTAAILQLINDEYLRLLQEVSLEISNDDNIELSFVADCPSGSTRTEFGCRNVPLQVGVTYNITVTLKSCTPSTDHGRIIRRKITSTSYGTFEIVYRIICNCDCATNAVRDPSLCNGTGMMSCGVCECDSNRCGSRCDRIIGERTNLDCPRAGVNDLICSGPENGVCDCGCICKTREQAGEIIFGDACQCNNFGCKESLNSDGQICSGRGACCEGRCMCNSMDGSIYRGNETVNYCQCETEENACRDNSTGMLCNNGGTCGCNFCSCPSQYKGRYCELQNVDICDFSSDANCIKQCRAASRDERDLPDVCSLCNNSRPLLFVNMDDIDRSDIITMRSSYERITNLRLNHTDGDRNAMFRFVIDLCVYMDQDGCSVSYAIMANATHFAIVSDRIRDCPRSGSAFKIPVWSLAPIILGCLLVIGIAILVLIKVIFLILDYIEVKRWQKEAKEADFSKNQNPLYQSPEMKYENIAYGRE